MADRYFKPLCGLGVVYTGRMEGPGYCRELHHWSKTARALGSWVWSQPHVLRSLGAKVVCCPGDEMQRYTPGYSL